MTEKAPDNAQRESSLFESSDMSSQPTPPIDAVETAYIAKLQAVLAEAERDPEAFTGYAELGVVYQAARAIVLAARAGRPVTVPIPQLKRDLVPFVCQLLAERRSSDGMMIRLPVQYDIVESQETLPSENVAVPASIIGEYALAVRPGEAGEEQLYFSSFHWDRGGAPLPSPDAGSH